MGENYFGITDTGKIRTNNEDTFIAKPVFNDRLIAACVIDGVGGYAGGEVAARIARETILDKLKSESDDYILLMKQAIASANEAIYSEKKVSKSNEQMACVLTVALADIANNKFYYCHVGDTRLYLLRDHSLVKITRDHSFVGFLEDSGRLTEEAAMRHPKRNEINKALGFDAAIKAEDYIETGESPFLPGDIILLCSDGLSDMIGNSEMMAVLNTTKSLSEKAKALVQAANEAGGKDNITVVLVQNNKAPLVQNATKPVQVVKKNDVGYDRIASAENLKAAANEALMKNKKRSSVKPFLTFMFILILAALGWIFYQNYQKSNAFAKRSKSTETKKERNAQEQNVIDSINGNKTNEVFVLNTAETKSIVITDSISVHRDSLHIIGNGVTLVRDTSYNGPAITIAPSCRYLLLDSLTIENFDIGVLSKNRALHLKNVQFKNCRVPVQYNFVFKDQRVINGRYADTVFVLYNSDSTLNNY